MPNYYHFVKWLLFSLLLSTLSACGGGDESSSLLFEPDTGDTTTEVTTPENMNTVFSIGGQRIIPLGSGSTVITITTFEEFDTSTESFTSVPVLPNVPLRASVTGKATLEGGQKSIDITTDSRGQASFTVNYPAWEPGHVLCSVAGRSNYKGGATRPLHFGGSVSSKIIGTNKVTADGTTGITVLVSARDGWGTPIPNEFAELSLSAGAFVVPTPTSGLTDANGEFKTTITSTVPQYPDGVAVTPIVGGLVSNSLKMFFEPISSTSDPTAVTPEQLDIIVKSNNVLADGESEAVFLVVARDAMGVPIDNIPINITSGSATAFLRVDDGIENRADTLSVNGNTGSNGRFDLYITNTVEEEVSIIATTTGGAEGTTLNAEQIAVFTNEVTEAGTKVTSIVLGPPVNNGQPANGTDSVSLRGIVSDELGNPVAEQTVSIIVSGGSATVNPAVSTTDASGRFFAELTDTIPESFKAKAVVGNVESNEVTVRFKAISAEPGVDTPRPRSINLFAVPDTQNVGESINLNAVVRDSSGTPMSGVRLFVSVTGGTASTAVIDSGEATTDGGGNATFTVSNTQAGTFNVSIRAVDEDGNPLGVQSNSERVEFIAPTTPIVEVETLIVTVVKNDQPANGSDAAQIDIVARDRNGSAVSGVPLVIQMSTDTAAIANPSKLETDDNGFTSTQITSTRAGTIAVTFAVEGVSVAKSPAPVSINFTAVSANAESTLLENVEMTIKDSPQPADGESKITVIVKPLDDNGVPITDANVELIVDSPNVTGTLTGTTNALGEFRTTLTSTIPEENIKVTAVVVFGDQRNKDTVKTITFTPLGGDVADLTVSVIGDDQLANGTDAVQIVVVARDNQSRVLADVPIIVTMPKGTQATAIPSRSTTNEDGVFSTEITSLQTDVIPVTVAVDSPSGLSRTIEITFKSEEASAATVLDQIDLLKENSPQVANGEAAINLTAVPYGTENGKKTAALVDINIELVGEPEGLVITPNAVGKTNSLGKYPVTITSTKAGKYTITPLAWKDGDEANKFKDDPIEVEFKAVGSQVKELTVDVINDNQPVGTPIQVAVVARDEQGVGLPNIPIVVRIDTQSKASAAPSREFTDENGVFITEISSTEAGTATITIQVEGTEVAHSPVGVTFVAGEDVTIARTELTLSNAPQPADGTSEIVLIVRAYDERGEPVPGKEIELIVDSDKISIANATGTTNALGEFRTVATTEIPGTYNVTPFADGVRGEVIPVTFVPVEIPIPNTLTLTVTGNNQEVGQEATLTVLARDEEGLPVAGVPVIIRVEPGDEPPDVTGSVIFGGNGFKGATGDNGIFTTTVQNSRPGTFKTRAFVDGTSLSSNTEVVTFTGTTTETPDVAKIELIASSPQLKSEGWRTESTESVIITAILRNKDNNLVPNVKVNFEVDSGEIQPVQIAGDTQTPAAEAISDAEGRAYARLTTKGNPDNRTITVVATVATSVSDVEGPIEDTIEVEVTGTTLTISGPTSITTGDSAELEIQLVDSDKKGIGGRDLKLESALGNVFDNAFPRTDSTGRVTVVFTASVPGQDTITASKENVSPATLTIDVSDDHFILTSSPEGITNIPLDQTQEFVVSWSKSDIPQVNQQINLATTRGELSSNSVLTDFNGEARFTIKAVDLGPGVITASVTNGPSAQLTVRFVAERVDSMVLQATPSTIGVNLPGTEEQTSEISAVVRLRDNLVPGIRVNFSLNDPTGGRLSAAFKVTDDSGRATVQYIAGGAPSASGAVVVTTTVEGMGIIDCEGTEVAPSGGCMTRLTVALREAFVSLGTGNVIEVPDAITNRHPYKALVTDINGAPIPNMEVVISVIPVSYDLGYHEWQEDRWAKVFLGSCLNEDVNLNSILDPGEDININPSGALEPGNVVTFAPDEGSIVEGNTVKVKTGSDGFASFALLYTKQYSHWVTIKLIARVEVAGSEDTDEVTFTLWGAAEDYTNETTAPPGQLSPYNPYPCVGMDTGILNQDATN